MEPSTALDSRASRRPAKDRTPSLQSQLAADLATFLKKFPNQNFAIRILAKESGLNEKTIRRLLSSENRPTYQTTFKLYSIFLERESFQELLAAAPPVISSYLKEFSPSETISHHGRESKLIELLRADPISAELFVLAGTGGITSAWIKNQFGQHGLQVLKKLVNEDFLAEVNKGTFQLATKVPNLDGEALLLLGKYFVRHFSRPRAVTSENTIAFYAEELNSEGLKAWLKEDRESFYRKLEIAKNPAYRGDIKTFTFSATEQIERQES